MTILSVFMVVISYVLGSVSFAVLVSRAMGLRDPRTFGSKNPGATNVLRTGNKSAAALTLLGDAAKGGLAVWLATRIAPQAHLPEAIVAACAVAVYLGHVFPVFLHFRGGKGVATALGVLLAIQPWLALATLATWCIVAYASRYSSLAALVSAVFAPLYYALGGAVRAWPFHGPLCLSIVIISLMLFYRHQANIRRLLKGGESRIGAKTGREKSPEPGTPPEDPSAGTR